MTFTINGIDMLPYIAQGGIKWTRNDIDAPNAGRALDGTMYRGRVCHKVKLEVTCMPLTTEKLNRVLNAIYPEYVTVTYDDPLQGGTATKVMYSNNVPATCLQVYDDGTEMWTEITFPLVER